MVLNTPDISLATATKTDCQGKITAGRTEMRSQMIDTEIVWGSI